MRRFCLTTKRWTPAYRRRAPSVCRPASEWPSASRSSHAGRPRQPVSPDPHAGRSAWPGSRRRHWCRPAARRASGTRRPRSAPPLCRSAAGSTSHTPTSSARSACFSMASKWLAEMRPQPTSANRMRRSVTKGLVMNIGPGVSTGAVSIAGAAPARDCVGSPERDGWRDSDADVIM